MTDLAGDSVRLVVVNYMRGIEILEDKDESLLNKVVSEQILMYYNRYLHDNGLITDKEYIQMNTRISLYMKNKAVG